MGFQRQSKKTFQRICYQMSAAKNRMVTGQGRPQLIFIHTHKTGGTSISSYFKEHVGSKRSGRIVLYDDFVDEVDLFRARAKPARFVTGHMPWAVFEQIRTENSYSFTFLRDPHDRLRSLYYFLANLPLTVRGGPAIEFIRELSLREFLTSKHPVARRLADNFIARQFAGALSVIPETQDDRLRLAEAAIANLSTLDMIGFNDGLDDAFVEIARVAGLPPPPLGRRVNRTTDWISTETGRERASQAFDEELRELAQPFLEADLIVYNHFLKLREEAGVGWLTGSGFQHDAAHHGAVAQVVERL